MKKLSKCFLRLMQFLLKKLLNIICVYCLIANNSFTEAAQLIEKKPHYFIQCNSCHGIKKYWIYKDPNPYLAGQNENYLFKEMMDFKQKNPSKRYQKLMSYLLENFNEEDLKQLANYYSLLPSPINFAQPFLIEKGKQLYQGGDRKRGIPACSICHDPAGRGNPQAGFPRLSGQSYAYTLNQLKNFRSSQRYNDLNHVMEEVTEKMNEEDMKAVANYISGLY